MTVIVIVVMLLSPISLVSWAAGAILIGAERRQTAYRNRLAQHPMHQHNGRPCYRDCLERRRDAA